MGNSLLTISMITKESLRILKNELAFTKGVNRQYDSQFANSGAKIGSVINIRKPVRYTVTDGPALNIQDVTDQSVALTLNQQKHVGFQFSSKDMTLSIDEFGARYIKPAIVALANKIDYDGLQQFKNVANLVGAAGTVPNTALVYLQAGQKLDEMGCPVDGDRSVVINPAAQAVTVDALKGLFQSSERIKEQYEKGRMGEGLGFTFKMDQNVGSQTVGPLGGTPLVDGTGDSLSGNSISTKGWTSAAAARLNIGDVFTIGAVNAVNPQTRVSTGSLQQFVVTAAFSSSSSGKGDVSIYPAIIASGQYQTVDALPLDGAAITVVGSANTSYAQNLAYHKDAFCLGMADLDLPGGVEMADRARDPDAGLSLRIVRAYDINSDNHPCRIDVLYGWQTLYAELACRITA